MAAVIAVAISSVMISIRLELAGIADEEATAAA
jgi:hypothetical protein